MGEIRDKIWEDMGEECQMFAAQDAAATLLESQAAEIAEARGLLAEWKTAMPNGGNPADNCECCYCRRDAFLARKEVENG